MKKVISIFLSFYILIAVSVFGSAKECVVDNAKLLTIEEKENLSDRLTVLNNTHSFDILIVTVENTGSKTNREFADDFYDFNNYGYGSDFDGMILLINMNPQGWYISTSGRGIRYFTDYGIQKIGEHIRPSLSAGQYSTAFHKYLDISEELLIQAEKGNPYKSSKSVMLPILFALVIALISVGIMVMSMNTARRQSAVRSYQKKLNLINSQEMYLYSHTTSRVIETSDGKSSSHRSSSGRSHGGGGGRF